MPRRVQYRIDTEEWVDIGDFALDTRQVRWQPPKSGNYQFRSQSVDALGEFGPWGYSNRLLVAVARGADSIYEALPDGKNCPPADRAGTPGRIWYAPTPDGLKAFIDVGSPFDTALPAADDVTADGLNGVLWRWDDVDFTESSTSVWSATPTTMLIPSALTENPAHMVQITYYTTALSGRSIALRNKLRLTLAPVTRRQQDDFIPAIEQDLFAAIQFADGSTQWWTFGEPPDHDRGDPYDSVAKATKQFDDETGSTINDCKFIIGRRSHRCEGDPLNPWVPLAIESERFIELTIYTKVVRGTAAPAAPANAVYDFDSKSLSGGGVWSLEPPDPEDNEVVYARIGTVSSNTPGSIVWSTARPWTAGVELDAIYRRAVAKPSKPVDSTTQVPAGWSATASATTGTATLWVVNQHRTGDNAVWQRGEVLRAEGTDGEAFRTETIYGAHTENSLADNQKPLDSWTYEQIRSGHTVTRNGVVWASNLTDAGFSKAKEYGYVARREVPNDVARGDAVSDEWKTTREAHWGLGPPVGSQARFIYDDIGAISNDGGYQFYDGGSTTAGSGTALNGDWTKIKDADYVEIGDTDKDGWPTLEFGDLTVDDFLVYEPSSSQWIAFDISSVTEITNGLRFGITRTEVSDGSGEDVPVADGNNADFLLSVPRRGLPEPLRGAAIYNGSKRAKAGTSVDNDDGYFDFHTTATNPGDANDITSFGDTVKNAKLLRLNENDEHGNAFDSLDALRVGEYVAVKLLDTHYWAAWEVKAISQSGEVFSIELELYSYAPVIRGSEQIRYPQAADVQVFTTSYVPPTSDTLGVRIRPIDDQDEGATSIPYVADVSGTALANGVPTLRSAISRAGPTPLPSSYRIGAPEWKPATRTAEGTITFPASISENTRVLVGVRAILDGLVAVDNEFILHKNTTTSTKLPVLGFSVRAGSSPGDFLIIRGDLATGATGWRYKLGTTEAGARAAAWTNVDARQRSVTRRLSQNRTYYVIVGQTSTLTQYDDSDASAVKSATTDDTIQLDAPTGTASADVGSVTVNLTSTLHNRADGWEVAIKRSSASSFGSAVEKGRTDTSHTFTGLSDDTSYDVRFRETTEHDDYEDSPWTVIRNISTKEKLPDLDFSLSANRALPPRADTFRIRFTISGLHASASGWDYQFSKSRSGVSSATVVQVARSATHADAALSLRVNETGYGRVRQRAPSSSSTYGTGNWSDIESITTPSS